MSSSSIPSNSNNPGNSTDPDTPLQEVSAGIDRLAANADKWANLSFKERLNYLYKMREILNESSFFESFGKDCARVRFDPTQYTNLTSIYSVFGPGGTGLALTALIELYESIVSSGGFQAESNITKAYNGQSIINFSARSLLEKISYGQGVAFQTFVQKGKAPTQGTILKNQTPAVSAILAAGNFEIPTDIFTKMFIEGKVCVWKPNPVNALATWPSVKKLFSQLINDGYLFPAKGGADVGQAILHNPKVSEAIMTGGQASYDKIVWSNKDGSFTSPEQIAKNKLEGKKNFDKPFDAELGGVGPWFVTPGVEKWTAKEILYQAQQLVFAKTINMGHICVSPQVVILDSDWPQRAEFIQAVKDVLVNHDKLPTPYYPGSSDRQGLFEREDAMQCGSVRLAPKGCAPKEYSLTIVESLPSDNPTGTQTEAFGPVLTFISIPCGNNPSTYLKNAVEYANNKLYGSLACSLMIDDVTSAKHKESFEKAVADLEYGCIGVNVWGGMLAQTVWGKWGAFPKHTPEDIQSGIGNINNFRLVDFPEKCVQIKKFIDPLQPSGQNANAAKVFSRVGWFYSQPSVWRLLPVLSASLVNL